MKLEQIFLYVTFKCNCRCITCYIRDHYSPIKEIPIKHAQEILSHYRSLGAHRLTLLGGEPSLYKGIFDLIEHAKTVGYKYIRIQTNGQFDCEFLENKTIQEYVDTFSFSIDGATEKSNKKIRIGCSLGKTLQNMSLAKSIGFDIRVNVTVTSSNINELFDIINVVSKIDPSVIYLNIVFPMGGAVNKPSLCVNPLEWKNLYEKIKQLFVNSKIKIKLPVGYANTLPIDHQCIALNFRRLYVMPNGDAYPCILFIDNPNLSFNSLPKEYLKKIMNYFGVSSSGNLNFYCPILKERDYSLKPLCLYYRKIFGGDEKYE